MAVKCAKNNDKEGLKLAMKVISHLVTLFSKK